MVWDSPSDGRIALLWGCEIEGTVTPQLNHRYQWETWFIKTGGQCFHFLQSGINSFYTIDFCVDRNFLFNMLHSQLSIIFVLATGAIAPVIGLPLPSGKGPSGSSSSTSGTVNPLQ